MEKVIKYKCSECGELFDTPEMALAHEIRHERIERANEMLNAGYTLQQINDGCGIWAYVPKHLENINKDNCFKISHWQCCDKPAYQIIRIYFDGYVDVRGCGSWSGYYGNRLRIDSYNLKNPRPKEELFVDPRYEELYGYQECIMKIINRGRGIGKTSMLISTAYVTGDPIITYTMRNKNNLIFTAKTMGMSDNIEVYTMNEWLEFHSSHMLNDEILVDNVELMLGEVLSKFLNANVIAGTMTLK